MKNKTRRNSNSFNFKSTLQKKMPVRIPLSLFVQKICWSFRRSWSWPTQCRKMVQKEKVCSWQFQTNSAKKMQRAKGGGRKLKYPEMDGSLKFHFYFYLLSFIYLFFPMNSCFCKYEGLLTFSEFWRFTSKIFLSNQVLFRKKIEAQRGALLFSCFRNSRLYFKIHGHKHGRNHHRTRKTHVDGSAHERCRDAEGH